MAREIQGSFVPGEHRFAIVASRTNDFITDRLLAGALDALARHGCQEDAITVVRVPGAFELPLVAKKCAESGAFAAVISLGCIIRGQTPHFDYIAGEAAKGLAQAAMDSGVPVTFGVVTADSLEQAIDRAGGKAGNKGADAAVAAIELANLVAQLPSRRSPGGR